jgi:hypothetical protein
MMNGKELALSLLQEGNTCALVGEGKTLCSTKRGVAPLLAWLENEENCQGMFAADKVVGRAAAFLYVLLGVSEVHALVLSESAEEVLLRFKIPYSFEEKVPAIRNRSGDGFCPMEQAVLGIEKPLLALAAIRSRLKELQEEKK